MGATAVQEGPSLDRDAPMPLYFQLREALLGEIRDRRLQPGDRLSTEADLERRYGVSRATIRQALNDLAAEGTIRRVQGKGTFVGQPKIRHTPLLTSFTELLQSQGYTPSHRIIESSVAPASGEVAASLRVPEGASCRHLLRLFLADGNPIGLADTWLPRELLGANDALLERDRLREGSLYRLLEDPPVGLDLHRAVETISPGVADEGSAGHLRCDVGSPVLSIRRVTFDRADRPVECTLLVFAGDRYEYRVEMNRRGART